MDDEETLGLTFGSVTGEFMRLHVIPELDAYRFAKYASTPGINTTEAALTRGLGLAAGGTPTVITRPFSTMR